MVTAAAAAVETLDSLKSKLDRGKEGEREREISIKNTYATQSIVSSRPKVK